MSQLFVPRRHTTAGLINVFVGADAASHKTVTRCFDSDPIPQTGTVSTSPSEDTGSCSSDFQHTSTDSTNQQPEGRETELLMVPDEQVLLQRSDRCPT